jgi:hypothetical protein
MTNAQAWTSFFGWLTIVNMGIYTFSVLMLWLMRGFVYRMNATMFGVSEGEVAKTVFKYVGAYKLIIAAFCFAPWLTLKLFF